MIYLFGGMGGEAKLNIEVRNVPYNNVLLCGSVLPPRSRLTFGENCSHSHRVRVNIRRCKQHVTFMRNIKHIKRYRRNNLNTIIYTITSQISFFFWGGGLSITIVFVFQKYLLQVRSWNCQGQFLRSPH